MAALRGRHLGVVFQAGELINELTPIENVLLPALLNPGQVAQVAQGQSGDEPTRTGPGRTDPTRRAEELLAAMGLELGDTPTDRLSGGVNRPGVSGDFEPWEGWSHARRFNEAVPAGAEAAGGTDGGRGQG